ncbi:Tetraspanin-36 [Triplophysa tibetana]|uniref:Tetraspanin-36 n=1 Tax=Triplophysa tibetana TaxID=1572043 RepID=A0A5A9NZ21_9TELE|nr:Tetraspanin-36 [Triplophysa tibetana]
MDCGIITSKTVLLLLSLIFWGAGVALAYVGSYVIKSYKNFEEFVADKYNLIPAAIIIGVAVLMFVIGIVGCCATLKESKIGLGFIKGDLEKSTSDVFKKYDGLNSETQAVDYLQTQEMTDCDKVRIYIVSHLQLECCGVQNYTDWTATPWFGQHNNSMPRSCCKANATQCSGLLGQPELLNTEGCESKLEQMLQGVLSYAMLVILGFAMIQLFGMFSICVITCRSRKNDYQPLYA